MDHGDDIDAAVHSLRRFNRSYTQRIGVLDDSFLGSGRPLGVARLLFEIGPEGAAVHELRERLGLDSGYVSRMLRQLEGDDVVVVATDPRDGRRRLARLTERGREEWDDLDRRSDALAGSLVAPLTASQRQGLRAALDTAELLLRAATVEIEQIPPRSPEAAAAMQAYFAELDQRFPGGFDPGDALTTGADSMAAPTGAFLVARSDGAVAACGGLQRIDARTAEVKRMWVHPDWRGAGLGSRLLAALEGRAHGLGHDRVVLDTNATLTEAIAMYTRHGYAPTERYNDNPFAQRWFEKALAAQHEPPGPADGQQ